MRNYLYFHCARTIYRVILKKISFGIFRIIFNFLLGHLYFFLQFFSTFMENLFERHPLPSANDLDHLEMYFHNSSILADFI